MKKQYYILGRIQFVETWEDINRNADANPIDEVVALVEKVLNVKVNEYFEAQEASHCGVMPQPGEFVETPKYLDTYLTQESASVELVISNVFDGTQGEMEESVNKLMGKLQSAGVRESVVVADLKVYPMQGQGWNLFDLAAEQADGPIWSLPLFTGQQ